MGSSVSWGPLKKGRGGGTILGDLNKESNLENYPCKGTLFS